MPLAAAGRLWVHYKGEDFCSLRVRLMAENRAYVLKEKYKGPLLDLLVLYAIRVGFLVWEKVRSLFV